MSRRWHNQPLQREPDAAGVRRGWMVLLAFVTAAVPLAAYLFGVTECLKLDYAINALHTEEERLVEQQRMLRVERTRLETLSDVEAWAKEEGGLCPTSDDQTVIVRRTVTGDPHLLARGPGDVRVEGRQ